MLTIEFVLCCLLGSETVTDGPLWQRAPTRKKYVSVAIAMLIRCMDISNNNSLVMITRTMLNVSISKDERIALGTSFDIVNFLEHAVDVKECCLKLGQFFCAHEYLKAELPSLLLQKTEDTCNECEKPAKRTDTFWENTDIPQRLRENREMFEFIFKVTIIAEIERATERALQHHAKGVTEISVQSLAVELQKVPCAECKPCNDIADSKLRLQRMPDWHLIQKSIDNNYHKVIQITARKCIQEYLIKNKQQSCVSNFDRIVKEDLRQQLADVPVGQFTAEQKNRVHPEVCGKLEECALQVEVTASLQKMFKQQTLPLTESLCQELESSQKECAEPFRLAILDLPRKLLERRETECYDNEVVTELKQRVSEVLSRLGQVEEFSAEAQNLPSITINRVHVWVLQQQLLEQVENIQAE